MITDTKERIKQARRAAIDATERYRDTMNDASSDRDAIKAACNAALTALVELTDLQTEYANELIAAGQIMGDYIAGKKPGPKS